MYDEITFQVDTRYLIKSGTGIEEVYVVEISPSGIFVKLFRESTHELIWAELNECEIIEELPKQEDMVFIG